MSIDERAFEAFMLAHHENGGTGLGFRKSLEAYEAAKTEQPNGYAALVDDVEEYLHWRKVNPQIKGGENYLKRFHQSIAAPMRESGDPAYEYACRLFKTLAPQCEPLPNTLGVLTQLDNYIAGLHEQRAYPECSGNPSSCPENEGYGCCKPDPTQGAI